MRALHDAAAGALLGLFCGDALGMPYETQPPEAIPERLEMEEARLGRGTYTDDTQMAIALAESLLRCDGIDDDDLARAYAEAFDPERGYGPGTTEVVRLWRSGVGPRDAARKLFAGRGSMGNGAAMRVAPVGVRYAFEPRRCEDASRRQASLTHAHPEAIGGAAAVAAAVASAMRGEDDHLTPAHAAARGSLMPTAIERAADLAKAMLPSPAQAAAELGSTTAAIQSVPAALLAASAPTFEEAVTYAVRCGGDTDTVAAMAGAIAGARHGASAIPQRWLDALEDGPKGRRHVEALATDLALRLSAR